MFFFYSQPTMDDLPLEIIYHILSFTPTYKDALNLSKCCKLFRNSLQYVMNQTDVSDGIKQLKSLMNIRSLYKYSTVFSFGVNWIPCNYLDLKVGTDGSTIIIKHQECIHYLNQMPFDFWIRNLIVDFCHKHKCLTIEFYDAHPDDCTRFQLNVKFWPTIRELCFFDYRGKENCLLCKSVDYEEDFIKTNIMMSEIMTN
jgi:hypothetical protein